MTREIKFRVWDKDKKKMSLSFGFGDLYGYEGELNAVGLEHPFSGKGQDFNITNHDGGGRGYPHFKTGNGVNRNLEFMQFTGLLDKNGKEIYEGDIVKYFRYNKENIKEVKFETYSDAEGYAVDTHYGFTAGTTLPDAISYGLEIIGNIYENPELLTNS